MVKLEKYFLKTEVDISCQLIVDEMHFPYKYEIILNCSVLILECVVIKSNNVTVKYEKHK